MAFGDFADRMTSTKRMRTQANPFHVFDARSSTRKAGKDLDTLFAGAPEPDPVPESIGKTLVAQDGDATIAPVVDEQKKKKPASTISSSQALGRKRTVLGG